MQFKFKKSTKPAEVPRLGWTIFIGLIGSQALIGAFDPVFNETLTDRLGSGAVGIGFSLWAILRVTQMKNFEYKLRKQPSLAFTIFLLIAGLFSFTDLFSSTVTPTNNQSNADRLLVLFVGIYFTLWALLRYIFGRKFEEQKQ